MLATIEGILEKHTMTMNLSHFEMVQVPSLPFTYDFGQHQETVLDKNKLEVLPNNIYICTACTFILDYNGLVMLP
jgi:hypothetical protein